MKITIVTSLFAKGNMKINTSHSELKAAKIGFFLFFYIFSKPLFVYIRYFKEQTLLKMTRLDQLMKYLSDAPNDSFLLFAIAKEHESNSDATNAFAYYLRLVEEHENYVGTYYHLGKLYEKTENVAEAIKIYKKGMEIAQQQGDRHAFGELATAKMNIDDEDEF